MNYEIVELGEKKAAGIKARTNNTSPDMGMVIGELWGRFYSQGIYDAIPGKVNNKALGVYTEYAGDEQSDYTILVSCEVDGKEPLSSDIELVTLPAGKYAKFIAKGDMHGAVAQCWQEIWNTDLPRSFVCDFEEYQDGSMDEAEIHIYVGLKE